MSYPIIDAYSPLNSYKYPNKSSMLSALDWLSTPCRRVFGGRDICVLSQSYLAKMPTTRKVIVVIFSILIFPIIIISMASLMIKLATCPNIWEKKKIKNLTQQVWSDINKFDDAYNVGQLDCSIQIIKKTPELLKRSELYQKFYKIINVKINNEAQWDEVQNLLPFLRANDIIGLINWAVKLRLKSEFQNKEYLTNGHEIIDFVTHALNKANKNDIKQCYKKLLSDAFQMIANENILETVFKMNLADQIIVALLQISVNSPENQHSLEKTLKEKALRRQIFKSGEQNTVLQLTFDSKQQMFKINEVIEEIRQIHRQLKPLVSKFNQLSAQEHPLTQGQLNTFRNQLATFQQRFNAITATPENNEDNYTESARELLESMIHLIDSLTSEQLKDAFEKFQLKFPQHEKNAQNVVHEANALLNNPWDQQLISLLKSKKRQCLYMVFEETQQSLLNILNKLTATYKE